MTRSSLPTCHLVRFTSECPAIRCSIQIASSELKCPSSVHIVRSFSCSQMKHQRPGTVENVNVKNSYRSCICTYRSEFSAPVQHRPRRMPTQQPQARTVPRLSSPSQAPCPAIQTETWLGWQARASSRWSHREPSARKFTRAGKCEFISKMSTHRMPIQS